ncbi:LysR substrate-binding domain-containing protein [Coraliomargarita algicola]|uniref:LysR substrate-binding domain-containing protein n=1 Tax=Coraliomargarita algicola TaxID=3092156 RepID=A0ABZ0RQ85_9BACT|nr:LysR substrate-binding domain-containing protein [Coraliomargarita sp. J2-16]WPJ97404.1 LysR substrate-binding domain-containing protein [Coraliomargarita sp. J2-16]
MDLRQLRYFTEAAEAGSISAAAKRCSISQPSLSQQIMSLEEEVGEQLMERRPRGIELTAGGELLLRHAKRLLREESILREQLRARSELQLGKVHFGIIPTLAPYLLPRLFTEFQREYPSIEIEVIEDRTSSLIQEIVSGKLEFAILSDVADKELKKYSLQTQQLFSETLLLATYEGHPLTQQSAAPTTQSLRADELIHLKDGHCLRDQVLRACGLHECHARLQCDQLETALAMVAANLGIAVVPELAVNGRKMLNVALRRFASPMPTRKIYLLHRSGTQLSKAARKLLEGLRM